jgi:hypothetical protein
MRNGYAGIVIGGTTHTVTQNVSTRNGMHGFEIGLSPSAGHPLATFSKNSAVANRHVGIHVVAQSAMGPPVVLAKNNLYGNDEAQNNCGLFVDNADTGHMLKVTATGNFWGASTGPGTNPADAVGGVCNLDAGGGINLNTNSPATKEFGVGEKPLK